MMMEWILLQECNMQGFRQIYRTAPQSRIGDGTVHSSSNIIYKHQSSYHVNLSFTYGCCVYTEVFYRCNLATCNVSLLKRCVIFCLCLQPGHTLPSSATSWYD